MFHWNWTLLHSKHYSVTSYHLVPECFGVLRRQIIWQLNQGHHIGIGSAIMAIFAQVSRRSFMISQYNGTMFSSWRLGHFDLSVNMMLSVPVTTCCPTVLKSQTSLFDNITPHSIRIRGPFVSWHKMENRKGVEWIDFLRFYFYL